MQDPCQENKSLAHRNVEALTMAELAPAELLNNCERQMFLLESDRVEDET